MFSCRLPLPKPGEEKVESSYEAGGSDILRIEGELLPPIDPLLDELLERGKTQRVMILAGTESPTALRKKPYATTKITITFSNERDLRECVRLLRWSDERLRARPEQLILWDWQSSHRDGMTIQFGVGWYDRSFFEKRKDAFKEPRHRSYYAAFGAKAEDFKVEHQIHGEEP